jgi:hypothetical protein
MAVIALPTNARSQGLQSTNGQTSFSNINIESNPHQAIESGLVVNTDSFTPYELDAIVRRFARTLKPQFDLGAATARLLVPRTTNYMAALWYSPGKGKPALLCKLDFNARVIGARVAQAIREGDALPPLILGVDEPTPESGVPGSIEGLLTANRVDSLVKAFVADRKIDFDFSGIRFSGLTVPKTRIHAADVHYRHEFGKPALLCKVGWDGRILENHVGNARPDP